MNQQSEALKIASEIELAITCGFIGSAAQYQHLLLSVVSQLRALHARDLLATGGQAAATTEGATNEVTVSPDGSAFAVYSYPLPKDHWLYAPREYEQCAEEPKELAAPILTHAAREQVVSAIRYAVRAATDCGKETDFDPDALVQNAVYALCGPFNKNQPQPQEDALDAAWSDLKIAFDIPDGEDETLWKCVESGAITLPNGWKLIETTGAGGVGPVAVFRTEHLPTSSETFVVGSAINYAIAASKEKAK